MNVDHLIDIASTLLSIPAQGRPRQANLRRAVKHLILRNVSFPSVIKCRPTSWNEQVESQ